MGKLEEQISASSLYTQPVISTVIDTSLIFLAITNTVVLHFQANSCPRGTDWILTHHKHHPSCVFLEKKKCQYHYSGSELGKHFLEGLFSKHFRLCEPSVLHGHD